jgi:hypothetical protein
MLSRRLFFLTPAAFAAPSASVAELGGGMSIHFGEQWDKPFLYPLRTVSGLVLSRRYPVETVPGEQTDHAWHRGLWYGHGNINGHDFWRELGPQKTARLVPLAPPRRRRGGLELATAMQTAAGDTIGEITQRYAVRDRGPLRFLDVHIRVRGAAGRSLTFGDTDDGGFGFRLSDAFREDRGARLRNSEGGEGTKAIWGKAARWVDYAAVIGGVPAGVAVFDHPSNLRHPTQWHARGYSLCAANPFAARSFNKSAPDGAFTLPPDRVLDLRYRVLIHEGPCEPDRIETLYRSWR